MKSYGKIENMVLHGICGEMETCSWQVMWFACEKEVM